MNESLNPGAMLLMFFALLVLLAQHARFQHAEERECFKRRFRAFVATCAWTLLRGWWALKGAVLNRLEKLRVSRHLSPHLYLDTDLPCMTLAQYMRLVAEKPQHAETVMQRLARIIKRHGVDWTRTLEARYRCNQRDLRCYNAFAGLEFIDPRTLDELVEWLQSGQQRMLVLAGHSCSGKTALVYRLKQLLLEAEPVACVRGAVVPTSPLRLISAVPSCVGKRGNDRAFARALADLGVDVEEGYDSENSDDLDSMYRRHQLPPSITVLDALTRLARPNSKAFTQVLLAAIGLPDVLNRDVPPLSEFETKALPEGWLTQPVVEFRRISEEEIFALASVKPTSFSREALVGSVNFARYGKVYNSSREAFFFDGAFNKTALGMLTVDDFLRSGSEELGLFLDTSVEGLYELPHRGQYVGTEALVIGCTRFDEYERARAKRGFATYLERCFMLFVQGSLSIPDTEKCLANKMNRCAMPKEIDPLALAYASRLLVLSQFVEPGCDPLATSDPWYSPEAWTLPTWQDPRCYDGVSPRLVAHILMLARERSIGETITLADVRAAFQDVVDRDCKDVRDRFIEGGRISSLMTVLDAWANDPHPVLELKRLFAECRRELRKQQTLAEV